MLKTIKRKLSFTVVGLVTKFGETKYSNYKTLKWKGGECFLEKNEVSCVCYFE